MLRDGTPVRVSLVCRRLKALPESCELGALFAHSRKRQTRERDGEHEHHVEAARRARVVRESAGSSHHYERYPARSVASLREDAK